MTSEPFGLRMYLVHAERRGSARVFAINGTVRIMSQCNRRKIP